MAVSLLAGGCKRSVSEATHPPAPPPPVPQTIARVHWLGMTRIADDINAASFMTLWDLPESAALEAQTLDKLALAMVGDQAAVAAITNAPPPQEKAEGGTQKAEKPAGTSNTQHPTTNIQGKAQSKDLTSNLKHPASSIEHPASLLTNHESQITNHSSRLTPSPKLVNRKSQIVNSQALLLRPLLDDLVQEECYLEMQQATNQPPEFALAIRLDEQHASLWTSNLSAVLGSMTSVQSLPAPAGHLAWRLPLPSGPSTLNPQLSTIEMARAGDWSLVGLAAEHTPLLDDFAARIRRDRTPFAGVETGTAFQINPVTRKLNAVPGAPPPTLWLEAALNLQHISSALALGPQPPHDLPKLSLAVAGEQTNVHTRVDLDFPKPLPLEMQPWNIPTNLIHNPLIGLSAVRGFQPWLKSFKPWNALRLGTQPNQAFFWAQGVAPFFHFLAAPSAEASNQVSTLSELVLRDLNPILATNGWPKSYFVRQTNSPGLMWQGVPYFFPALDYADCGNNPFIVAGLAPDRFTNQPPPAGLSKFLQDSPKLVAYDWEDSKPCLDGWTQMAQLARHMLCRARMTYTAGLDWVAALAPHLGNSTTEVHLTSPTQLSFVRSSTAGFTGFELQLVADWLESPVFPRGLHTLDAPAPPPPIPLTNAPAPPH